MVIAEVPAFPTVGWALKDSLELENEAEAVAREAASIFTGKSTNGIKTQVAIKHALILLIKVILVCLNLIRQTALLCLFFLFRRFYFWGKLGFYLIFKLSFKFLKLGFLFFKLSLKFLLFLNKFVDQDVDY